MKDERELILQGWRPHICWFTKKSIPNTYVKCIGGIFIAYINK